uniref:Loss of heterozygosity 11 chromosomal region 2 gene A protein homolog n=2 Tax=Schistosoma japonicum TaxID=6182 RepID=C1LIX5_SCHJA|nr:Loss of heterozygosity 11 chromosomal region 2 gene A protein homolog [Schistosoma japonicum]
MNVGWALSDYKYLGLVCQKLCTNIPLKGIQIKCDLVNILADVSAEFLYENTLQESLEASFVFPLNNVAVYHFEAQVGGNKIVSVCRPRSEARETYDSAVEEGHTAILAEQDEHCADLFQMNIGNIPPSGQVIIVLRYIGQMEGKNMKTDTAEFSHSEIIMILPSVINPRYYPKERKHSEEFDPFTELVLVNSVPYTITFEAHLWMQSKILDVKSIHDSFTLDRTNNPNNVIVKLASGFVPDHDLQMVISLSDPLTSLVSLEYGDSNQSSLLAMNCLMVQILPDIPNVVSSKDMRNEFVFLIDRSGSMEGDNISYAKTSLLLFLKSLPVNCRFQIIGFGSNFAALFSEPTDYSEDSLNAAMNYQKDLNADMGGTEAYNALKSALHSSPSGEGWFKQIIFLTDGDVGNADEVIGLVRMNVDKARVFTIGLGQGVSTALIGGVARVGNGTAAYVRDASQLQSAVMETLSAALQPRADNIKMDWNLVEKLHDGKEKPIKVVVVPRRLSPLFPNQFSTYFGFFKTDKSSTVEGHVNFNYRILGEEKLWKLSVSNAISFKDKSNLSEYLPIHRLAGNVQMNELVDEYHSMEMDQSDETKGKLKSIREEVEELSCKLNILSKFTALVAVDPTKLAIDPKERAKVTIPLMHCKQYLVACAMPSANCGFDTVDCGSSRGYSLRRSSIGPPICCFSGSLGFDTASCDAESYEEPVPVKTIMEKHIKLAELQSFSGSWTLDSSLCECLAISLDDVTAYLKEPGKSSFLSDVTWGTALVIAFLELYMPEKKNEWCLIVDKAKCWLSNQAKSYETATKSSNELSNELIEKAKLVLTKLVKPTAST